MAEVFAEPLPPDAVATIKARLRELAAAGGYQIPDVPDDVILKAIEMAARDEDAAGVDAAGAEMAGAADAFEEAAGGRRCRGKRLNKFRAAPFKMPYTPMPSYKPRGGVGMFAELAFHAFAAERRDGEEWETNGRKYKRQGGRTVRIAGSANQSQATRIVGDAAAPRADNAAGPAGGAGPGTQGGVGMETQTQEEAAVYGPRETGPMGAVARPVNDARFRRAGDRVLADPGFRRDLTDAFNRMTLYREFEDGVVEIPRLFHELRRRRPGVTLDQFHAALAAAAGRRQIHLMGADSPALAPGKELAMEDGRNLLFYVVPPQGRRLGAEQLAPV